MRRARIVALMLAAVAATTLGAAPPASGASGCTDVMFIGARGSGQTKSDAGGFGPQVDAVRQAFTAALPGLSKFPVPVQYASASVNVLAPSSTELKLLASGAGASLATSTYLPKHVKPYLASIDEGVAETMRALVARRSCSAERIILAGYSQGAIVMHRAMQKLASGGYSDIISRVDGAVLIADGDRVKRSGGLLFGSPPSPVTGEGIAAWLGFQRNDVPARLQAHTIHLCTRGDIVCEAGVRNLANFPIGAVIHTGVGYISLPMVSQAGQLAASWVKRPGGTLTWVQESSLPGGVIIERAEGRLQLPSRTLVSGQTVSIDLTLTKTYPSAPSASRDQPCVSGANVAPDVRAVNFHPNGSATPAGGSWPGLELGSLTLAAPAPWTTCFNTGRQVTTARYTGPATYFASPGMAPQTVSACGVWSVAESQNGVPATTVCRAAGPSITVSP